MAKKLLQSRTTWILLTVLGLIGLFFGIMRLVSSSQPVSLVFTYEIRNPSVVAAVESEIMLFKDLNPQIDIRMVARDSFEDNEDLAVLTIYPKNIDDWSTLPAAWSGRLWVLAGRKDILEGLEGEAADLALALAEGRLEPPSFELLLSHLQDLGYSPITLGNSHRWPYMLWLQFLSAATLGPEEVLVLPSAEAFDGSKLEEVAGTLQRWRAEGWFHEQSWNLGWAQGLGPLDRREAVFALLSETQLTALSPETRAKLAFYRFPRLHDQPDWSIGSAHYLALSKRTRNASAAKLLFEYLVDPGTTSRLSAATGRPFFSWDTPAVEAPIVINSWSTLANTLDFQDIAEALVRVPVRKR